MFLEKQFQNLNMVTNINTGERDPETSKKQEKKLKQESK